jgi:hypothetical protein
VTAGKLPDSLYFYSVLRYDVTYPRKTAEVLEESAAPQIILPHNGGSRLSLNTASHSTGQRRLQPLARETHFAEKAVNAVSYV